MIGDKDGLKTGLRRDRKLLPWKYQDDIGAGFQGLEGPGKGCCDKSDYWITREERRRRGSDGD